MKKSKLEILKSKHTLTGDEKSPEKNKTNKQKKKKKQMFQCLMFTIKIDHSRL